MNDSLTLAGSTDGVDPPPVGSTYVQLHPWSGGDSLTSVHRVGRVPCGGLPGLVVDRGRPVVRP